MEFNTISVCYFITFFQAENKSSCFIDIHSFLKFESYGIMSCHVMSYLHKLDCEENAPWK